MEQKQKMTVPEFGGWDQKAPGATDYSVVFNQARANKKQQKNNLTEIKPIIVGNNEGDLANAKGSKAQHHRRRHTHAHAHAHANEGSAVMVGRKKILTFVNCCIKP